MDLARSKTHPPVRDLAVDGGTTVARLMEQWRAGGGFTAKKLAVAADLLHRMVADKSQKIILSFPAALMATGTRGVLRDLVKHKRVDAVITTCGTLDHDLARLWEDYYAGSFEMDDRELHQQGVNRLGNVLVPNSSYGEVLEAKLRPLLEAWYQTGAKHWSTRELSAKLGEWAGREKNREESLLYWAWKNQIPVFVPGPTDGAVGAQVWMTYQQHRDLRFDLLRDEQELSDLVFSAKRLGALMVGGGISKHHTIWWSQFRGGLDTVVYLTTAQESDGSLSGARVREAVSWGKVKEDAQWETVEGDASVLLPLLAADLEARLGMKGAPSGPRGRRLR
ncbi:MAG TPA: deoxyhypusine synthase [Candidatus Thermoplasmatota archaeon]|nr:deoxyhypusine synthase [Candidatus Thermoplasmatota archaeon]